MEEEEVEESPWIVQKRTTGLLQTVTFCTGRDLVALVGCDGTVTVYRVFSWEKVQRWTAAELFPSLDAAEDLDWTSPDSTSSALLSVKSVAFSQDSKFLAVGASRGGAVAVIAIDAANLVHEPSLVNNETSQQSGSVVSLHWLDFSAIEDSNWQCLSRLIGQTDLLTPNSAPVTTAAAAALGGVTGGRSPEVPSYQALSGACLVARTDSGVVTVYSHGAYPLWSGQLPEKEHVGEDSFPLFSKGSRRLLWFHGTRPINKNIQKETQCSNIARGYPWSGFPTELTMFWSRFHKISFLDQKIATTLRLLETTTVGLLSKWRDAIRILPAKTLLANLLSGYEFMMTPLQFWHSIAACGLWHPATIVAISSYWNEAGIQRVRTSLDGICRMIGRSLQFCMKPQAVNLCVCVDELSTLMLTTSQLVKNSIICRSAGAVLSEQIQEMEMKVQRWADFNMECRRLLGAIDSAMYETRRAQESGRLFFSFVLDCVKEVEMAGLGEQNNTDKAAASGWTGPDLDLRQRCCRLFSPSPLRAPQNSAEHLLGTNLLAVFSDSVPRHLLDRPSRASIDEFKMGSENKGTRLEFANILESLVLSEAVHGTSDWCEVDPQVATVRQSAMTRLLEQAMEISGTEMSPETLLGPLLRRLRDLYQPLDGHTVKTLLGPVTSNSQIIHTNKSLSSLDTIKPVAPLMTLESRGRLMSTSQFLDTTISFTVGLSISLQPTITTLDNSSTAAVTPLWTLERSPQGSKKVSPPQSKRLETVQIEALLTKETVPQTGETRQVLTVLLQRVFRRPVVSVVGSGDEKNNSERVPGWRGLSDTSKCWIGRIVLSSNGLRSLENASYNVLAQRIAIYDRLEQGDASEGGILVWYGPDVSDKKEDTGESGDWSTLRLIRFSELMFVEARLPPSETMSAASGEVSVLIDSWAASAGSGNIIADMPLGNCLTGSVDLSVGAARGVVSVRDSHGHCVIVDVTAAPEDSEDSEDESDE